MSKFLWIMFGISCFASVVIANEKVYLDSESIILGNNGIFAKIDGDVIQIPNLACDEHGLYVQSSLFPEVSTWYCEICNKHRVRRPCYVCNNPGPKPNPREK